MVIILILLLIVIAPLLLFVILGGIFYAIDAFLDLPYVATKKDKIGTIIKLAKIKHGETVVDLGCGDGRLLFAAAKLGAFAIGYEVNPFLVLWTRIKAYFGHLRGVRVHLEGGISPAQVRDLITVKRRDLWRADLSAADVIFVYGRKHTMKKFQDFVFGNAKKGARIIVNTEKTVPFPTKKPIKSENGILLYIVKPIG